MIEYIISLINNYYKTQKVCNICHISHKKPSSGQYQVKNQVISTSGHSF